GGQTCALPICLDQIGISNHCQPPFLWDRGAKKRPRSNQGNIPLAVYRQHPPIKYHRRLEKTSRRRQKSPEPVLHRLWAFALKIIRGTGPPSAAPRRGGLVRRWGGRRPPGSRGCPASAI